MGMSRTTSSAGFSTGGCAVDLRINAVQSKRKRTIQAARVSGRMIHFEIQPADAGRWRNQLIVCVGRDAPCASYCRFFVGAGAWTYPWTPFAGVRQCSRRSGWRPANTGLIRPHIGRCWVGGHLDRNFISNPLDRLAWFCRMGSWARMVDPASDSSEPGGPGDGRNICLQCRDRVHPFGGRCERV